MDYINIEFDDGVYISCRVIRMIWLVGGEIELLLFNPLANQLEYHYYLQR